MSKFKIEVASEEEEDPRETIRLKLEQDSDGVDLLVVDENGDPDRYILTVTNDGALKLYEGGRLDSGLAEDDHIEVIFP